MITYCSSNPHVVNFSLYIVSHLKNKALCNDIFYFILLSTVKITPNQLCDLYERNTSGRLIMFLFCVFPFQLILWHGLLTSLDSS